MDRKANHHIIPKEAKCVFEGVRNTIFQWDQKMYDGSIATFERNRFTDGSFTLPILENGNILLTLQTQPTREPFISLPGGGFDSLDEDPLLCAQRELLEETGYTSDDWQHWFRFDGTSHVVMYVYYYIARNCKKIQKIQPDAGEKISLFEVTFDEFLDLASDPRFHHHWNLLPLMYEARLDKKKYRALREILYGNHS